MERDFVEVERAASLTREIAQGRVIERVETTEDNLVYSGITHEEFVRFVFFSSISASN